MFIPNHGKLWIKHHRIAQKKGRGKYFWIQDDAQRKSEKIRAEANQILDTNKNVEIKSTNIFANLKKPEQINLFGNERKSVNLF